MTNAPAGTVALALEDAALTGDIVVPEDASGFVAFAHGTGSGRRGDG